MHGRTRYICDAESPMVKGLAALLCELYTDSETGAINYGTTELLLTMPISPWQAILGKFLAAASTLAVTLLFTLGKFAIGYYLATSSLASRTIRRH